jgi:sialate O-acetylesterase
MYQNTPTGNYNGMIAPLHPLGIKGVLWYQGESNAGKPDGYGEKLIRMASHWRQKWGQGDFPFLVAQLPNWSPKGNVIDWSRMREEQMKILTLPNTGVAVTYDSGESNDLHPLNKKAVGERLASEALRLVYGATDTPRSPYIKSILKSGNDLHLCFETDGSALKAKNAAVVAGLSIWYKDIQVPVPGEIHKNKMVIKNVLDGATDVSYAWCDDPRDANLYNLENLPAYPFKKQL